MCCSLLCEVIDCVLSWVDLTSIWSRSRLCVVVDHWQCLTQNMYSIYYPQKLIQVFVMSFPVRLHVVTLLPLVWRPGRPVWRLFVSVNHLWLLSQVVVFKEQCSLNNSVAIQQVESLLLFWDPSSLFIGGTVANPVFYSATCLALWLYLSAALFNMRPVNMLLQGWN